jgi:ClpP class serine protease
LTKSHNKEALPPIGVTEFDPARVLATLERAMYGLPVLLLRGEATRSLLPSMLARANALSFGDEPQGHVVEGEVATLAISGPLYQRAFSMCGMAVADGYDAIAARARAAFNDPKVGALMMEVDSPGGDAAGVLELADLLSAMSAESNKPLVMYAAESAASAAYWLGSAASSIVVPRSGELGSIGAIVMTYNESAAMDAEGVRAIIAAYPRGKSAGWDVALSPPDGAAAAKGIERMQARAEEIARLFAGDVAQRRGLTLDHVLGLDAAMLSAGMAKEKGLADIIGGRAAALAHTKSKINRKVYSMDMSKNVGATKALVAVLALGGLTTEGAERSPEEVAAALKEVERLTTLGKAVEASTGQRGAAALEVTTAWRDGAARVPGLETRVKIEALQGRLATAYPPAVRFALAPALGTDGRPHPRAGLPDPSAGPHETFAGLSLDVFDARTSAGTIHPALTAPPQPSGANSSLSEDERRECARQGITEAAWIQARANLSGGTR